MARKLHSCTLTEAKQGLQFITALPPNANCCARLFRCIRISFLISEKNPRCKQFYRSIAEIMHVKRWQASESPCLIIHPFSIFRLYYEMWMSFVLLICIILMPLFASFQSFMGQGRSFFATGIYLIFCIFCYVDIMVTFITGYVNEKEREVIMAPLKIVKHYLFGVHFICDCLSAVPDGNWIASQETLIKVINILGLLKIARIATLLAYLSRTADFFNIKSDTFKVVRCLILIILVFHCFACFIYLVPQIRYMITNKYHKDSWMYTVYNLAETTLVFKYMYCFYRATGYVLCINYQVKEATVIEEVIFACFAYCFGKVFMISITVVLVKMILARSSIETKYYEIMEQLDGFMKQKKLPPHMRKKLLQYYTYKYNRKYFKENKITNFLSETLKREINAEVLHKLTTTVTLFAELPYMTLENILAHLHIEIYMPTDVIVKAGSPGDSMYFIASGTVSVTTPSGKEICHLQDGAYFGEVCLVLNKKRRTANVIAVEICEVYKLTKKGFKSCLRNNKNLMRSMEMQAIERLEITDMLEDIYKSHFLETQQHHGATHRHK